MGILQSKKVKQGEKHPFNKDIKNGAAKEAAAKKETDFNHGEANDLTGNLNDTSNTSQGLGPTQLISHQMETSNGNEAMLTRMHQVPAVDALQNREQSIHKAVNISQDANSVKYIPYLASAVRVTQEHISPAKPKDKKTCTPKPMLQQATPARPTAGPCRGVKITAGELDALRSDILQQLQDVTENLSQQQSRPSAPVQQQANRQVMYGHTQHEESRNYTPSQQRPATKEATEVPLQTVRTVAPCDMGTRATADSVHNSEVSASVQVPAKVLCKDTFPQVECSFGNKEQREMIPQLPASEMQAPVRHAYREVVRGVTTENLHSKKEEAQTKAKINKSPSQKSNCVLSNVNEASTDLTCHATDKVHNIAEQSTTTKPGIAEVPAAKPTVPPDHLTQMSNQSKAQVNNEENARHEHSLNHNSVTNMIAAAMEENTIKKHNEPQQIPQPNKADNDTNGNTSSCIQKVNVKALAPQVAVVEGMPTAAPNNAATHNPTTAAADTSVKLRLQHELKVSLPQDTAVKPKEKCTLKALNQNKHKKNTRNVTTEEEMNEKNGQVEKEKQETGITPAVPPEHKVCAEGRWHPFTVNQSCSRKVRCKHNPETGLPPNVQKWFDESPNYLCEPPWVTTARLAACLALRETEEEGGDSHQ